MEAGTKTAETSCGTAEWVGRRTLALVKLEEITRLRRCAREAADRMDQRYVEAFVEFEMINRELTPAGEVRHDAA